MRRQKFFWPVFGLCGLALINGAWAADGISLEDCFRAALKRSEILAVQEEQVIQAEEHYRQARGGLMPDFYAQGAYLLQESDGANRSNPIEQHYAKLAVTQPLFRGFREYAALAQTQKLISAQKLAKQWAGMQLYSDTSQAFYNVIAWQKDLEHLDAQIELYARRIRDLQARMAIGRSRDSEVLSVQTAQALLKAQRQQTAGQLEVAREILAFVTGMEPNLALQAPPDALPAPESLENYLTQLEQRPDVLAARERVEAARKYVEIAKGAHWPSVDLAGNYYFDRSAPNQNIHWDAQIVATLPIFMGGIVSSQTTEAESVTKQFELDLSRLQRSAAEDIRNAHHTLESDLAQLKILEEALRLAQKNFQAILRDYNYGLVNNLDVLQAMSSYQDTLRSTDRMRFIILNDFEHLEALAAKRLPFIEGK